MWRCRRTVRSSASGRVCIRCLTRPIRGNLAPPSHCLFTRRVRKDTALIASHSQHIPSGRSRSPSALCIVDHERVAAVDSVLRQPPSKPHWVGRQVGLERGEVDVAATHAACEHDSSLSLLFSFPSCSSLVLPSLRLRSGRNCATVRCFSQRPRAAGRIDRIGEQTQTPHSHSQHTRTRREKKNKALTTQEACLQVSRVLCWL